MQSWHQCFFFLKTQNTTVKNRIFFLFFLHTSLDVMLFEICKCVFWSPGDGAWYRAMVNGVSEDKVAVNFVDYGYSMDVQNSHLRAITPQLLTLPFQAVRCWLTGSVVFLSREVLNIIHHYWDVFFFYSCTILSQIRHLIFVSLIHVIC